MSVFVCLALFACLFTDPAAGNSKEEMDAHPEGGKPPTPPPQEEEMVEDAEVGNTIQKFTMYMSM